MREGSSPGRPCPVHPRTSWLVAALVAGALLGCSRDDLRPPRPAASPPSAGAVAASPTAAVSAQQRERKLVRDAELHLAVSSYEEVRGRLDRTLAGAKGYVASAKITHVDDAVSNADLTLRVPAPQLDAFIAECSTFGTVLEESVAARDVSDTYYDTAARLTNARRLEQRLLELLATKTEGVKDLLEVERELARVREQIETLDGTLRGLDADVAMSRLELRLTTRSRFAGGTSLTFLDQVKLTFGESVHALTVFARSLALLGVALLPWLPLLALGVFVAARGLRWLASLDRPRPVRVPGPVASPALAPAAPPGHPAGDAAEPAPGERDGQ